jgi:hypothetical protein
MCDTLTANSFVIVIPSTVLALCGTIMLLSTPRALYSEAFQLCQAVLANVILKTGKEKRDRKKGKKKKKQGGGLMKRVKNINKKSTLVLIAIIRGAVHNVRLARNLSK